MSGGRKTGGVGHKRPAPFALRLSVEERAELERRAGELALGAYIKTMLFCGDGAKQARRGARKPVRDHVVLAEVLACLGQSRLGESLEQLAVAAESGSLRWDDDAPVAIQKACEDIAVMRLLLMQALGFRVLDENDADHSRESLRQSFTRHARDWDQG